MENIKNILDSLLGNLSGTARVLVIIAVLAAALVGGYFYLTLGGEKEALPTVNQGGDQQVDGGDAAQNNTITL